MGMTGMRVRESVGVSVCEREDNLAAFVWGMFV